MVSRPPLLLASSSPYKRALLQRLGIPFSAERPDIDEARRRDEPPLVMARRLSGEKTDALATDFPNAAILGGDQVIALDDQIFSKPKTSRRAVEQLTALQGKTHELICAICLRMPDGSKHWAHSIYQMVMRPLDTDQIEAYVDDDSPLDCAGSYRIEAAGIRLFEATHGDDPTAIEGLPLTKVWSLLLSQGWQHD